MQKYFIVFLFICGVAQKVVCDSDNPDYHNDYDTDDEPGPDENVSDEDEGQFTGPPPMILTKPLMLEARPGDTRYLPCEVKNADNVAVMWLHGLTTLYVDAAKVTADPRIQRYQDNSLQIRNISSDDVGLYTCRASSSPPVKVEHVLNCPTCAPRKPTIFRITQYPTPNPIENTTFSLFCEALGPPQPTIMWRKKNGKTVSSNQRADFSSIRKEDAGEYFCSANNGVGGSVDQGVTVQVQYGPDIKVHHGKVVATVGHEASLVCEVRAHPHAKVMWKKEGAMVGEDDRVTAKKDKHRHILHFSKVTSDDFARYTCAAQNDIGNNTKDILLLDNSLRPKVKAETKVVHSGIGYEAILTCEVMAEMPTRVWWEKDGEAIRYNERFSPKEERPKYSLSIMQIRREDFGNYTCVAENEIGATTRNIEVTGRPTKAKLIEVVPEGQNRIVRWSVESRSPVQKHVLRYRKDSDGKEKWTDAYPIVDKPREGNVYLVEYVLPDLDIGGYEVVLTSENEHGWSDNSEPFKIQIDYRSEGQRTDGDGSGSDRCRVSAWMMILILALMAW